MKPASPITVRWEKDERIAKASKRNFRAVAEQDGIVIAEAFGGSRRHVLEQLKAHLPKTGERVGEETGA